jgi:hypothetical protein
MQIVKKHRKPGTIIARDEGRVHIVSIPWRNQSNHWWNESCASVVEVFGLPGDRYSSHPSEDNMDFYFKSEKDANLCRILISEKV